MTSVDIVEGNMDKPNKQMLLIETANSELKIHQIADDKGGIYVGIYVEDIVGMGFTEVDENELALRVVSH